jgi:prepilin-type processing-associated H-X9-DG protein/prepilin-type N-terminal cleavage/methylation domain-containing protein
MNAHSHSSHRVPAFTLIEVLVVVAIIALLIAILIPSLVASRNQSKRAACGANTRQIGIALTMYTLEHRYFPGDHFHIEPPPSLVTWMPRLLPYLKKQNRVFWCPSAPEDTRWDGRSRPVTHLASAVPGEQALFAYGYNAWGVRKPGPEEWRSSQLGLGGHISGGSLELFGSADHQREVAVERVRRPAEMIAVADNDSDVEAAVPGLWDELITPTVEDGQANWPGNRHQKGAQVLFVDGHTEHILQEKLVEPSRRIRQRWNNDFRDHCDEPFAACVD